MLPDRWTPVTLQEIHVNAAGRLRISTRKLATWCGIPHEKLTKAVAALNITESFRRAHIDPAGEGFDLGSDVLGFLGHVLRKPHRALVAELLLAFNAKARSIEQARVLRLQLAATRRPHCTAMVH